MAVLYLENLRIMTPHRRNKLRILHLKIFIKIDHRRHMNQIWNLFYGLKNFCEERTSYDNFGNVTLIRQGA